MVAGQASGNNGAASNGGSVGGRLLGRFFAPVDIASLVVFRIAFGLIMLWETWRYTSFGWVTSHWIEPEFHFTYFGFGWVQPWPGVGMYIHWGVLAVLAICITLGLFYRIAMALFFVGFTYVFLLEQAQYLNHFYLVCLISFTLIFVPAHRAFSLDARLRPSIRSDTAPAWSLGLVMFQVGIAYFYAGVAKINEDWLRGEPMRDWLADSVDLFPVVGPLLTLEWVVFIFIWGGMLLDLFVVPLLLWHRTRPFAFAFAVAFHLTNVRLFDIGIFPWLMIAATTIFFRPDWPRRLLQLPQASRLRDFRPASLRLQQYALLGFVGLFLAFNVFYPLRHFVYPERVSWTEEGHRFAWHMKLRDKDGESRFVVVSREAERRWLVDPEQFLTSYQAGKMSTHPDMILQFSHYLAERWEENGHEDVEVYALTRVSLNGREPQPVVNPRVDLAAQPRDLQHADWVAPLKPLPDTQAARGNDSP